ncbi:hypothetical protein H9L19_04800 [Weissella diestrammenae]|uniref:Uncharacterized protein n=1 Tax=Weissella diestrammenae TaxID=1162633 RepID=A0A7G9T3R7_9LACO|nr:hypothetical protein [Weissella diestrammenae]MCM0582724.1 hypothetical protein [Weissella diestrammenae]QNN74742.1 hypothetical protein H9L19_04800 [Weissella diestrammenae]
MAYINYLDYKKRIKFIETQLGSVDSAIQTLPILLSGVENQQALDQCTDIINRFNTDLRKLYDDLAMFNDIKF